MVICYFNIMGIAINKSKAYSPLVVYPDAVLPQPVFPQRLQPIPRRNGEIVQPHGDIERFELPLSHAPELTRDSPCQTRIALAKQVGRRLVSERLNHRAIYILHD